MFKKLLVILILIVYTTGCSVNNEFSGKPKEMTSSQRDTYVKSQDAKTNSNQKAVVDSNKNIVVDSNENSDKDNHAATSYTEIFMSPIGVKTVLKPGSCEVFISSDEGWKNAWEDADAEDMAANGGFPDKVVLYKTTDGGKSWTEITNSVSTPIPFSIGFQGMAYQSGMTFLNDKTGWITETSPRSGYVGVYKTTDGGFTWQQQDMYVPDEYKECMFGTLPPVFFSKNDGLLLTRQFDLDQQLVYATHDGGKTWVAIPQNTKSGDLKWRYKIVKRKNDLTAALWEVSYKTTVWHSDDGVDWKQANDSEALTAYESLLNQSDSFHILDGKGNVNLFYRNGEIRAIAPLNLLPPDSAYSTYSAGMTPYETGFYISEKISAIVYGGFNDPVKVLISKDMGKTWGTYTVTEKKTGDKKFLGFMSESEGWIITGTYSGMGTEYHYIFRTSDGGKTWTEIEGNINELYPHRATGAGFANDDIGFLCFRVDFDSGPTIYWTQDGGKTWSKYEVLLPEKFSDFGKTPLSPSFNGAIGIFPIQLRQFDRIRTIYLTSDDYGKTWSYNVLLNE